MKTSTMFWFIGIGAMISAFFIDNIHAKYTLLMIAAWTSGAGMTLDYEEYKRNKK